MRQDDDPPAAVGAPDAKWHARLATGAPLTERDAKEFLAASGIAVTREQPAATADDAVAAARDIGFPVALKIESPDLPHKSDIGGLQGTDMDLINIVVTKPGH